MCFIETRKKEYGSWGYWSVWQIKGIVKYSESVCLRLGTKAKQRSDVQSTACCQATWRHMRRFSVTSVIAIYASKYAQEKTKSLDFSPYEQKQKRYRDLYQWQRNAYNFITISKKVTKSIWVPLFLCSTLGLVGHNYEMEKRGLLGQYFLWLN